MKLAQARLHQSPGPLHRSGVPAVDECNGDLSISSGLVFFAADQCWRTTTHGAVSHALLEVAWKLL